MTIFRHFLCALGMLLAFGAMAGERVQLLPEDEAERDQRFFEFRQRFLTAVQRREPETLVTMISSNVINDSGVAKGMQSFIKQWRLDAIDSTLWDTLEAILTRGGSFIRYERGVMFCAPYVFTHFPDDMDLFKHGVILDKQVFLKDLASLQSDSLRELSHDVVRVLDWRPVKDPVSDSLAWIKIATLDDGSEGYVRQDQIRGPADYHACFVQRRDRGWKLHSLVTSR